MRMWLRLLVVVVVCAAVTGCAGMAWAPVIPPSGLVYTSTSAPLDIDFDKTQLGTKVGRASTQAVLGLVAFGDASTAAAARNGGLTVIHHADYSMVSILGLYSSYTTIVYGG